MHVRVRNVNEAFERFVAGVHDQTIPTVREPSRVGEVLRIEEPVTISYLRPRERVLFNSARDANPFFHLFESIWMLVGQRDVDFVSQFNSQIAQYSDDGKVFHGAYGHRWRRWFGWDQLNAIVNELSANPTSRRCVLVMWDSRPGSDFYQATHGGKDVPCNTHAYVSIGRAVCPDCLEKSSLFDCKTCGNTGKIDTPALNLTVCNRSNDMIWGCFGANVVHMSFLQEYLANRIGVEVGTYNQVTNNLHVYTERWEPEKWLADRTEDAYSLSDTELVSLQANTTGFVEECRLFVGQAVRNVPTDFLFEPTNMFLSSVVFPMYRAYIAHKERDYSSAYDHLNSVAADDWRIAGVAWVRKRDVWYQRRKA